MNNLKLPQDPFQWSSSFITSIINNIHTEFTTECSKPMSFHERQVLINNILRLKRTVHLLNDADVMADYYITLATMKHDHWNKLVKELSTKYKTN